MNKTTNDGTSSGANNAVFAGCPEAPIVQEAEKQFAAAVTEFVQWRNQDVQRKAAEVVDTTDHLIQGVRLTLKAGRVATDSVARFREALSVVEGEMRQHQFVSMDPESMREIAELLDKRHLALRALIRRHEVTSLQCSAMVDELTGRFWAVHGIRASVH